MMSIHLKNLRLFFAFLRAPVQSIVNVNQIGDELNRGIAFASRLHKVSRSSSLLLIVILSVFVSFFVWASIAEVDDLTRADGRVIPSAHLQIIQNLEGGIVQSLNVRQGENVESGQLIASLSATQFGADRDSRRQQINSLEAKVSRLTAEATGGDLVFSLEVLSSGVEYTSQERAEYEARRSRLAGEISVLDSQLQQRNREAEDTRNLMQTSQNNLASARQELGIVSRMVEKGLEPRIELVRIQGKITELEGRVESAKIAIPRLEAAIEEVRGKKEQTVRQFKSDAASELGKIMVELRTMQMAMPALTDKVDRTEIRAPVKGILNRLLITTIGGVVRPGETIAEIVPADDQMVIEARIKPKDIGFVQPGMTARIKLTAYDYSIFGSMKGVVTQISADALPSEDRSQPNSFYFLARVETATSSFEAFGRKLPVIPGMQAQVDIITGNKTILTYLAKPVVAVKENAFRER
jgi:adhesin transport system membrane fusion protein